MKDASALRELVDDDPVERAVLLRRLALPRPRLAADAAP